MKSQEAAAPAGISPWHAVRRLVAYRPVWYGLFALCWILFHTWPLLTGLVSRAFFQAVDRGAPAGADPGLLAAAVAVLGLLRGVWLYAGNVAGVPYSFPARSLLQRNLLARILGRPGARALPGTVGEALSTLRDDTDQLVLLSDWAFDALAAALFALGGVAVLLTVDWQVTLLVFLPLAAVIALTHVVRVRLVRYREQSREASARVTGAIGELFGGVQAIWVAGAEERVVRRLHQLGRQRQAAALRDGWQGLWLDGLFAHTASLGSALVLLVAAGRMREGRFSVGDFALFAAYLGYVADFTAFLGYLINSYRQSGVSLRRAVALLQGAPAERLVAHSLEAPAGLAEAAPGPACAAVPGALETLEVRGLTCRHDGNGSGVTDISFTLRRGSLTVITGPVGSGKTTLLRALLGLLESQAGEIRWNGRQVADPAAFLVPPRAAYTGQVPILFSGTLRQNILLGLPAGEERLARAVRDSVLEQDLAGFPDGLQTQVGARGVRLSGGQAQRTAAARMLVREPELLVFDDLASALDSDTERQLWERLAARQATVLAVSHRPELLARADQILVLDGGRLITPEKP